MDYQKVIVVGNVTENAKRLTSKKGDVTYTAFAVAVSGGEKRSVFFPMVAFGKLGETIAEYLTKGRQVLVEGRIEVSEKGRFGVAADRIVLGPSAAKMAEKAQEA